MTAKPVPGYLKTAREYAAEYGVTQQQIWNLARIQAPLDDHAAMAVHGKQVRTHGGRGAKPAKKRGRPRKAVVAVDREAPLPRPIQALPDPEGVATEDLREAIMRAELKKKTNEAERMRLNVNREAGQLVSVKEVGEVLIRVCSAARGAMLRMESDLPPMLEGLSPGRMQTVIRGKVDEVLRLLADDSLEAYKQ